MTATTVVVASSKGGTGKTATAISMGRRPAQLGYKVLIVDIAPQGGKARRRDNRAHWDDSIHMRH